MRSIRRVSVIPRPLAYPPGQRARAALFNNVDSVVRTPARSTTVPSRAMKSM